MKNKVLFDLAGCFSLPQLYAQTIPQGVQFHVQCIQQFWIRTEKVTYEKMKQRLQ